MAVVIAGVASVSAQSWVVSPGTALPNDSIATQYFPYLATKISNVSYGSHNSSEVGDIYVPAVNGANIPPATPRPAVIVVHGGGGTGGARTETRGTQASQLLAAHGYVVFNIDYRVGAVWPNNIRDWRLAVRWLRANAATYNIDTNHIGEIGGSFGGYAAGILSGLTNGQMTLIPDSNATYNNISMDVYSGEALNSYSGDVQATMDMYGPMLFTGTAPFGDANGQYSSPTSATYYNASAVHYVHPTSAPVFITQGTSDTTVDITNSYVMTNALAQANVPYKFARIPNAQHTYCIFDSTKGGTWPSGGTSGLIDLRKDMCDFFDKWLLVSGQAPGITAQPQPQTGCVGSPVNFSVTANGSTPLTYQWQFNGTNISGATNTTYAFVVASTNNAGNYSVIVSNAFGTLASGNAALTVNVATPPAITGQPTAKSVLVGGTTNLSVTATGTALQYQWHGPAGVIAGATNSILTISNAQNAAGGDYYAVVFNTCNAVTSSNATLTVNGPPSITAQPGAQTACTGTSASFIVSATGSGTLGYQWSGPLGKIPGATGDTVTLTNLYPTNSGNYFVVVTNAYGAVTSSVALLTVSANSTIGIATQPTNTHVALGGTASFTVVPAGGGGYTYLWHAGDAEPIPHAVSVTSATLVITNAQPSDIAPYTCLVMNDCSAIAAAPANLVVDYAPVITQQPSNQTAYAGANVTLTVLADGTQPLTYQWRKSGVNVSGQTNSIFAPGIVTTNDAGNFDVVITNNFGSVTSSVATLTVLPSAAGSVLIAEYYMHGSKTGATYNRDYVVLKNVTASAVGLNGWSIQHFKTNGTWFAEALPNATIPSGGYYLVQCYADGATVVGAALPTPDFTTAQSSLWNLSASTGEAVALVNTTSVLGACVDASIVDKVGFNAGATCYFGSGVAPTGTTTQSVQRNNTGCANTANNAADFALGTPNPRNSASTAAPCSTNCVPAGISSSPTNQTVTVGGTASFSVTASGSSPFAYQWRKAGANVGNATNSSYNFITSSTNDGGSFDVVITNGCGSVTSAVATLTVNVSNCVSAGISSNPANQTVSVGGTASFSVTASGSSPFAYQWRKTGANIGSATNNSYSFLTSSTNDGGSFDVVITNGCGSVTSAVATLTVNAAAAATVTNFTASGTWVCPAGVTSVQVGCWGGGGSGGSAGARAAGNYTAAGGGAGGTYCSNTVQVTAGNTYSFTVASGGAGAGVSGTSSGINGNQGGTTTFGTSGSLTTPVVANGGPGGQGANASTAGAATNGTTTGSSGGTATAGGTGAAGVSTAATTSTFGGLGGTGGGSGGGAGGIGGIGTGTTPQKDGQPGTVPGGGGGGGYSSSTGHQGGAGGGGQVVLTYSSAPAAPVSSPHLGSILMATNGAFGFTFTNVPDASFTVFCTTNVGLPASNWTVLGPMTESPSGTYSFSDGSPTNAQRSYRVRSP